MNGSYHRSRGRRRATLLTAGLIVGALVTAMVPASAASARPRPRPNLVTDTANYYVAPNGNDSWSGTLAAPNATNTDGPFATIGHARDVLRGLGSSSWTSDITVAVRGGDYYLSAPISFGTADSGKNGHRAIYRNYTGEAPVIHGGQPLTGWTLDHGSVYRAQLGLLAPAPAGLVENGTPAIPARTPNGAYALTQDMVSAAPQTSFVFKAADVPSVLNPSGLQAVVWAAGADSINEYSANLVNVSSVNYLTHTITLASPTNDLIGRNSHYYLQGAPEFLDQAGEFAYIPLTGTVYYWPRSPITASTSIVRPLTTRILDISGTSAASPVTNLTFDGLTMTDTAVPSQILGQGSGDATVYLTNAQGVTVTNSQIRNSGAMGYFATGWAQQNTLSNSIVSYANDGCVGLFGPDPTPGRTTSNYINMSNTVTNNIITGCGKVAGYGVGVYVRQSGANLVSHNQISDTVRWGIGLAGAVFPFIWFGQLVDGVTVTKDNWQDIAYARDNVIEYNDISHTTTEGYDEGTIDTVSTGRNNVIRNNVVQQSVRNDSWYGSNLHTGIYMDAYSDGTTVANNLVTQVPTPGGGGAGWFGIWQEGLNTSVVNNVVASNGPMYGAIGSLNYAAPTGLGVTRLDDFRHNIVYNSGGSAYEMRGGWAPDQVGVDDLNMFYNGGQPLTLAGSALNWLGYNGSFSDWQQLQHHTFDQRSLVADPQFVNPATGDYRLSPTSPARRLGIVDLDLANVGLTSAFTLSARAADPLQQAYVADRTGSSLVKVGRGRVTLPLVLRSASGRRLDTKGATVRYRSSDRTVADETAAGVLTAKRPGITRVRVTVSKGGRTVAADAWLTVTSDPASSLEVTVPGTDLQNTIGVGASRATQVVSESTAGLYAPVTGASYGSSNTAIATVDANGVVTGVAAGTATITATATIGGVTVTGSVLVTIRLNYLDTVALGLTQQILTPGATTTTTVTGTLSNGSAANLAGATISYRSANTAAATISSAGVITAVASGRANVYADVTLGGVTRSALAVVFVYPTGGDSVPANWHVQRNGTALGYVTGSGTSFHFVASGVEDSASYQFLYQNRTLDSTRSATITATLSSIIDTGEFGAVGPMFRASSSASGQYAYVAMLCGRGGSCFLQSRTADGVASTWLGSAWGGDGLTVKLVRSGTLFTAYIQQGSTWRELAHITAQLDSGTGSTAPVQAGISSRSFAPGNWPVDASLTGVTTNGGVLNP